ncbi:MAG: hypothetical protein A2Y15_09805 [Clostridiales bacterium GWF2_36_10]|nr:MAG: hypothetical protein A2Y15_09805 [Clostridiales bacterium GWF2_36_10]HAN20202.1 hypothetical protein [Clostridiales bacterium]
MKKAVIIMVTIMFLFTGVFCVLPADAEEMTFKPTVKGSYLYGIPEKTTFDDLALVIPKTIIDIKRLDGTAVKSGSSTFIGTGFTVSLNGNSYTAIILGDVDGDGIIKSADYQKIKMHYLGSFTITGSANLLAAGDDDLDGKIKAIKYLMVKRHFMGTYNINVNYTVPYTTPPDDESGWTNSWV